MFCKSLIVNRSLELVRLRNGVEQELILLLVII